VRVWLHYILIPKIHHYALFRPLLHRSCRIFSHWFVRFVYAFPLAIYPHLLPAASATGIFPPFSVLKLHCGRLSSSLGLLISRCTIETPEICRSRFSFAFSPMCGQGSSSLTDHTPHSFKWMFASSVSPRHTGTRRPMPMPRPVRPACCCAFLSGLCPIDRQASARVSVRIAQFPLPDPDPDLGPAPGPQSAPPLPCVRRPSPGSSSASPQPPPK